MFRDKGNSNLFLLRDIQLGQDSSFTPQLGDIASLKVHENNIEIRVKLESEINKNWKGKIVSYHSEIKGKTPSERLDEIRRDEDFINDNKLANGTEVSFSQDKMYGLYRG